MDNLQEDKLQEAKDKVAQTIYNHKNWKDFRSDGMDWRVYEEAHELVAEEYADQQCAAMKEEIEKLKSDNKWLGDELDIYGRKISELEESLQVSLTEASKDKERIKELEEVLRIILQEDYDNLIHHNVSALMADTSELIKKALNPKDTNP